MSLVFAKKTVVEGLIAGIGLLVAAGIASGPSLAAPKKVKSNVVALNTVIPSPQNKAPRSVPSGKRYPAPGFFGKFAPKQMYKGLMLIESVEVRRGKPTNAEFITKIKAAIDLIEARAPKIFSMMKNKIRK